MVKISRTTYIYFVPLLALLLRVIHKPGGLTIIPFLTTFAITMFCVYVSRKETNKGSQIKGLVNVTKLVLLIIIAVLLISLFFISTVYYVEIAFVVGALLGGLGIVMQHITKN